MKFGIYDVRIHKAMLLIFTFLFVGNGKIKAINNFPENRNNLVGIKTV